MVERLYVVAACDICGIYGAEAHSLALDGAHIELDLCPSHQADLADTLSAFLDAARELGSAR